MKRFRPVIYYPFRRFPGVGTNLVVRTKGDPTALAAAIRNETRTLEPDVAIFNVRSMEELIGDSPAAFMRRFPGPADWHLCRRGIAAGVDRNLWRRFILRQSTDTLHRRANGSGRADFRHSEDGAETRTRGVARWHGDWSSGGARSDAVVEESAF